jgi:hypothetical protein
VDKGIMNRYVQRSENKGIWWISAITTSIAALVTKNEKTFQINM